MRKDKEKALKLRLSGKSYRDITLEIGVPKSTLSAWLSTVQLSEEKRNKINQKGRKKAISLLIERNIKQTGLATKRNGQLVSVAKKEINLISAVELRLIGASLYWAEGYKRLKTINGRVVSFHPVSFTNSDPVMVKLFLRFLRETCGVQETRIKASVRYFPHQNPEKLHVFWYQSTKLPPENFGQPQRSSNRIGRNTRPFNQLPYGTIQIRVSDTALYYKIMGWIEGLKQFS